MIHYHGTPITPDSAALEALKSGHAFVSFHRPDQLDLAVEVSQSFAIDNGAFSAWTSGKPITNWNPFFDWVEELSYLPNFDFLVIPDDIEGDVNDQTRLVAQFLQRFGSRGMQIGAPVYHLHEPLEHARRLSCTWPRVCIGSSGQYARIGAPEWWDRMCLVMDAMCDERGRPRCKIHGLRMLNPKIFTKFPFASADSTNVGRNIGIDSKWKGTYLPHNKAARALVLRGRIEAHPAAPVWGGLLP